MRDRRTELASSRAPSRSRPLTYVGTISYGLYLWHWPVDCVVTAQRLHLHGAPLVAIQFGITFAIAIASFHFYERPIRANGVPFGRPAIVVPAAVALALVLVVRSTHARKAIERPLPPLVMPVAEAVADAGPPFTIMVLGDSTANSLGWALRGVREPGVAVELRGKDSCTMLWDTCGGETWQSLTKEVHPDVTLVYVGGAFLHGLSADGRWRQACYKKWDAQFEKTLATRLVGLSNEATRAFVVTVPYPVGPYDSAPWREKVDCINASVRRAAATVPDVRVLELGERFCPKGKCEYEHDGFTVRPDGVHYDIDGTNGIAKWVMEQIKP